MSQNLEVPLLNVLSPPGRSDCLSPESSHARNPSSRLAEASIGRVGAAPHDGRLHLCDPALVLPHLLIKAPQAGHLTLPIGPPASVDIGTGN